MPGQSSPRIWPSDPTRNAPVRHRAACRYETFTPEPLATSRVALSAQLAGLVAEAERELRDLNDTGGAALTPLARLLLRTESIASSKIEGLHLGVRELARAEVKLETGGSAGPTAKEVIANVNAMTLALEEATASARFGEAELLAIHRRLLEGGMQRRIAGVVRASQNWIGGNDYTPCGADFVPPPPEDVPRLLDDLYDGIADETMPPVVQAALVHAQFETIHPFADGNGRTGRALVHVVLRRRGVAPRFIPPISVVFAGARARYIAGLTAFRGEGVAAWIEDFATALIDSARTARQYLRDVQMLQEEWRERLRSSGKSPRGDAAAWEIINLLPAYPIISAAVLSTEIDRSPGRIYEAIDLLVDAGVLLPISAGKRNRAWEGVGLLDLIERAEEG